MQFTHLTGVHNLHQDEELSQDSHKLVGVCGCVCMCMLLCMYRGGEWAPSQKAGWVHCVTAHVHSPPSIPASLCMFSSFFFSLFSPAEDTEIVETCPPDTFRKYRLVDCGSIHLNSYVPRLCISSEMHCRLCHNRKKKKEQYDDDAVKMHVRFKRSVGF